MIQTNRLLFGLVTCLVLFGGEAALGQSITLTSPPYVPPPPGGGGVGSFNAAGTWQMGAGQTISRIEIFLEEKLAGQANFAPVGGALNATRDNVNKTYSGRSTRRRSRARSTE